VSHPLQCAPAEKAQLETNNGVEQLDYIADLVTNYKIEHVRESHLLGLHGIAVSSIYPCGGHYRDALAQVYIEGSKHKVPEPALVPKYVTDLIEYLNSEEAHEQSAVHRAAYALWRFNWIHPFKGGNGRTARAMSYLILCMDIGAMIPGDVTVPSLIYKRRDGYVAALQVADAGVRETGEPDLSAMGELVTDVITKQMALAIDSLTS
tara:strand:- start:11809 stop:12429 length:621 start_codon:yes stop_codon:yes gene_type:complete